MAYTQRTPSTAVLPSAGDPALLAERSPVPLVVRNNGKHFPAAARFIRMWLIPSCGVFASAVFAVGGFCGRRSFLSGEVV